MISQRFHTYIELSLYTNVNSVTVGQNTEKSPVD